MVVTGWMWMKNQAEAKFFCRRAGNGLMFGSLFFRAFLKIVTVEYPGKIRTRHPEAIGGFLHRHVAQVILQNFAGMGGMEKHT